MCGFRIKAGPRRPVKSDEDNLWNATHNTTSLVPTEFRWDVERRAAFDVKKYVKWPMALIINEFLSMGELTDYQKVQFRKALLVSHEADCISKRERFYA